MSPLSHLLVKNASKPVSRRSDRTLSGTECLLRADHVKWDSPLDACISSSSAQKDSQVLKPNSCASRGWGDALLRHLSQLCRSIELDRIQRRLSTARCRHPPNGMFRGSPDGAGPEDSRGDERVRFPLASVNSLPG